MRFNEIVKYREAPELTDEEEKVLNIIDDILQRSGLCQEWESIEADIQDEIFAVWVGIIKT